MRKFAAVVLMLAGLSLSAVALAAPTTHSTKAKHHTHHTHHAKHAKKASSKTHK